jgi:hypothetical protein
MSESSGAGARLPGAVLSVDLPRGRGVFNALFSRRPGYLFSPSVDFLCLGGGSLIAMALLYVLLPHQQEVERTVALIAFLTAYVINHPHFANSYQIFYRNFQRKLFGAEYAPKLRLRYAVAGLIVPAVMAGALGAGILAQSVVFLGFAANAMMLLVGWHYVKQGYGMIILDSVLKRQFLTDDEKRLLRVNGYCCWGLAWILSNQSYVQRDYWGIPYHTFALPSAVLVVGAAAALVTTLAVLWMLGRRWRATGALPINGVIAYVSAVYAWTVFVSLNPLFLLVVPAFHSLQYLVVVWRYEANAAQGVGSKQDGLPSHSRAAVRFASFVVIGFVLGHLGFFAVPEQLNSLLPYQKEVLGPTLFLFVFWIFINIHHYFIDNVIWRGENPDTRRYLFGR